MGVVWFIIGVFVGVTGATFTLSLFMVNGRRR